MRNLFYNTLNAGTGTSSSTLNSIDNNLYKKTQPKIISMKPEKLLIKDYALKQYNLKYT